MFDQGRHRSHVHAPVWTWLAAAGLASAAVLTWHLAGPPSAPRIGTPPIGVVTPETQQAHVVDSASLDTHAERAVSRPSADLARSLYADLRLDEAPGSTEFVAWPSATAGRRSRAAN
jgi:hypothetical protein